MFKKITKEFLEKNNINVAEDFNNMELERLLKKEFEDEIENGECPEFCVNFINNIFELDESPHLIFKFCLQNKCSIESRFLPS